MIDEVKRSVTSFTNDLLPASCFVVGVFDVSGETITLEGARAIEAHLRTFAGNLALVNIYKKKEMEMMLYFLFISRIKETTFMSQS